MLDRIEVFANSSNELVEVQSVLVEIVMEEGLVSLGGASISLHAIVGTLKPRNMHVLGFINRKQVVILIDTRSTHNFLNLALVQKCKLALQKG